MIKKKKKENERKIKIANFTKIYWLSFLLSASLKRHIIKSSNLTRYRWSCNLCMPLIAQT